MKIFLALVVCLSLYGQETAPAPAEKPSEKPAAAEGGRQYDKEDRKSILGIIPNFRTTSVDAKDIMRLNVKEKFQLATRDSFDPGAFFTTALLTGLSHWQQQYYPDIPLGMKGYGWRYGLNFVDNVSATYF